MKAARDKPSNESTRQAPMKQQRKHEPKTKTKAENEGKSWY
jgi:hypothetical protein